MMDVERLIMRKCKEAGVSPDVLTEEERAELIDEIKAEQNGFFVLDGVLCNPEIIFRNMLEPHPQDRIVCVKVGKVVRENLYEMTVNYRQASYENPSNSEYKMLYVDCLEDYLKQRNI